MQFADLVAGGEYLISDSNQWMSKSYAGVRRARLVDLTKYKLGYALGEGSKYVVHSRGDRLKVILVKDDGSDGPESYVPTRKIRAPWAEGSAQRTAELNRQREAAAAKRDQFEAAEAEARSLQAKANALGLPVRAYDESGWRSTFPSWSFKISQVELAEWIKKQS